MIEIINNRLYYEGVEFQVLLLENNCVHIINEYKGLCLLIDNETRIKIENI
jgi:hypothetical protein